jgi:hypothetical protein
MQTVTVEFGLSCKAFAQLLRHTYWVGHDGRRGHAERI